MRSFLLGLSLSVRGSVVLLAVLLAITLTPQPAGAQVLYGSLVGTVTDESGAVVPSATVTLTNKGTGQVKEATTDNDGNYSIVNILPGVYDIKVTKQGFTTYTQTDLNISANNAARVEVKMKVGNVSDTVSVAADATVLQTESATVKSEISSKEINALPINNYRNYQSLLNLVPGTTPAGFQNANTDTPERSLTTNVNGTARNNNNTRLDGAQSVNIWLPHHSAYVPPSESVQEVNISTNNFDAEQGMAGGAAIQVITKSGTNQFHGSAFAYHDNHFFRAKNSFQPTAINIGGRSFPNENKPKNLRTIPGATFGGPIKKDKLFFFGSWEGMFERVIKDGRFSVPTADIRAGDFTKTGTTIYDPFTGNVDGTGRTAFAGNIIPASRISAVAQKILPLIPLPNLFDASGNPLATNNYYNSAPQRFTRNNYDVKVNWNRTEKHQVWYKFSHMDATVSGQYALGQAGGGCLCDGGVGIGTTHSYVGTVGHTWTLGAGFIVDGNFSITNRHHETIPPDFGKNIGLDVLGIPGTNGPDIRQSGFPAITFSTYRTLGNDASWNPVFRDERSYTFSQNATKLKGNHDLRFGADVIRHELNHWQPELGAGPRGQINFGGGATTLAGSGANQYTSFAAFLLGTPTSVQKTLQAEVMTTREWQFGFYVRDRWQVSRNLTLTLGLRYELYPIMHRADRGIERLDLSGRTVPDPLNQNRPSLPVLIGGKGGNPDSVGIESSKLMFAPRLGLAYRLGNDTVIRAGYGLTYDPMPFGRPLRGFYPATIGVTFLPTITGYVEGITPYGFTNDKKELGVVVGILPINKPDLSTGVVALPFNADMRSPYAGTLHRGYIQSWNLFVERKLPADFKVEVGYVGTQTTHQLADLDVNAAAAPNAARPLAALGRTGATLLWDGYLSANYHALQVAINRRLTKGVFVKGAYTWSKAINLTDDDGWAGLPLFNAPSQIRRNRARAGYDIPHVFQLGAAAELPFGKGKRWADSGATAAILGGWQLSSIFSAVAGRPFTVTASTGSLNAPGNSQTPDIIGDTSILGNTGPGTSWFNPLAFLPVEYSKGNNTTFAPADRRFGTAGRNILRNPGYANVDVSLIRNFRLTERIQMEFHVDAFNFTNTPHFNGPGTNASAPTRDSAGNILKNADGSLRLNGFTEITSSAQDQRQFRFGLRFAF
ncbi:MAG TPA: TonB-dependent receptor [Blastocatellia bacterium]|nr:TonB-dependent receptor [Blastocatellia bacterium]